VIRRGERLRIDESVGERRPFAFETPEQAIGVVADFLRLARAVGHQDVAGVAEAEDRLQAG
jgi:hypothetical protein